MAETENVQSVDAESDVAEEKKVESVEPEIEDSKTAKEALRKIQEELYSDISFFLDKVHDGLRAEDASDWQKDEAKKIEGFGSSYKELCKKHSLSAVAAKEIAEFVKDSGKKELEAKIMAEEEEIAAITESIKKYASTHIGDDVTIKQAADYTKRFLRDHGIDKELAGLEKDPRILHLMVNVRKSLVSASEVERAAYTSEVDERTLGRELSIAVNEGDNARANRLRTALRDTWTPRW